MRGRRAPRPLPPHELSSTHARELRHASAEQPLGHVQVPGRVRVEGMRAVEAARLELRSDEVAVRRARIRPAVALADARVRTDVLHELVVRVQNRHARLGEVRHRELVTDDREIGRRHEHALPDDAPERAVEVVDLNASVGAVGDVELRLGTAAVDEDAVRAVESPGPLFARERLSVTAVRAEPVHDALAVSIGDPDITALGRDCDAGGRPSVAGVVELADDPAVGVHEDDAAARDLVLEVRSVHAPLEADVADPEAVVGDAEAVWLEQAFERDVPHEPAVEVVLEERRLAGMRDDDRLFSQRDARMHPAERLLRKLDPIGDPLVAAHRRAPPTSGRRRGSGRGTRRRLSRPPVGPWRRRSRCDRSGCAPAPRRRALRRPARMRRRRCRTPRRRPVRPRRCTRARTRCPQAQRRSRRGRCRGRSASSRRPSSARAPDLRRAPRAPFRGAGSPRRPPTSPRRSPPPEDPTSPPAIAFRFRRARQSVSSVTPFARVLAVLLALSAVLVPVAAGGSNLLSNGTFDSSTDGWTTQNASLSRARDGIGGTRAALVTVSGSPTSYSIAAAASTTSTAGTHYLANASERSDNGGETLCLAVEEWTSSGSLVNSAYTCMTSTKSWHDFTQVDYAATSSGNTIVVRLLGSQPSRGDSFEADDVSLTAQQQQQQATAPANTSPPTISGTAAVGQTLTAAPGSWNGTAPISYAYQWQSSSSGSKWTNISSATAQTYTPTSSDLGDMLRVVVAASNSAGSETAASAPTAPVAQASKNPPPPSGAICSTSGSPPQHYQHVIWIWMENHSYDQIIGAPGSSVAQRSPYVNGTLVPQCGLATNYHNVSHPSLPNYIAATSGSTQGLSSNKLQGYSVPNLFQQVQDAGLQWRSYNEAMPQNCYASDAGTYPADHNPALDYTSLASTCPQWDVPLGTTSSGALEQDLAKNTLPSFAFVVHDGCDSSESCSIDQGDAWLSTWVPLIVGSSAYRSGSTAVFIVWDEGNKGTSGEDCLSNLKDTSCHVVLLALSPYMRPGSQSSTLFSHYSLLRTTEELLGLPLLGQAASRSTASMRSAFGL